MQNKQAQFRPRDFSSPAFWPSWIGLVFIYLLSRLPFSWQLKIAGGIGQCLYYLIPSRRKICGINLRLAFPEMQDSERHGLALNSYRHIGYTIAEMATLWFQPMSRLEHRFELIGKEYLDKALAADHGIILLQAHFSTLEFCGAWLATQIPRIKAVADEPRNLLYAALLKYKRSRYVYEMIDNKDIRKMIRWLKEGGIVWYSPDQSVSKRNGGIASTFFSRTVLTTPGTSRMARMTGARVLPYLPVRDSESGTYKLYIFPPMENIPTNDAKADTETLNRLFESHIRKYPEQYFWLHKRFKPPSKELPNPYK